MDDLISRQAAITQLSHNKNKGDEEWELAVENDIQTIWKLQPIQPKRGRWVLVCDNNGMHFICNKCGAWRYHQEQKFCGECGADMREKGENSETD